MGTIRRDVDYAKFLAEDQFLLLRVATLRPINQFD
jgi:hypothetical protein